MARISSTIFGGDYQIMTFLEFQTKSFPQKSVFDRPQFDITTNFVKWFAMRAAYVLYKMGMTANLLDVLGVFSSVFAFLFLMKAPQGQRMLPIIGILIIYFHIFIDFIDGAIAKARGESSQIGHLLDSLGCDTDRFAMIVLLGIYTGSSTLVMINTIAACIFLLFLPFAKIELPQHGPVGLMAKIYCNKFSFLSVRFMLTILPFFLGIAIMLRLNLAKISFFISLFYCLAAAGWLLLCARHYPSQNNSESIRGH